MDVLRSRSSKILAGGYILLTLFNIGNHRYEQYLALREAARADISNFERRMLCEFAKESADRAINAAVLFPLSARFAPNVQLQEYFKFNQRRVKPKPDIRKYA